MHQAQLQPVDGQGTCLLSALSGSPSSWDAPGPAATSGWSGSGHAERSQPTTSGSHGGRGRAPADVVDQLKRLKRDPEVKQAWEEHCRAYGQGIFDPSRHSADYLQDFIWAADYLQGKKKAGRNNRQCETQAARNERKWLSRVVKVEKLIKE